MCRRRISVGGLPMFKQEMDEGELRAFVRAISAPIENARFLCILFMSYVHLHFAAQPAGPFAQSISTIIVDVLGRSSVPLLSVISGVLMVPFFGRRRWGEAVRSRALTLLVPMVIWNAIQLLLFGGRDGSLVNQLFALTGSPALLPMAFLRDLFVVAALTPVLVRLVRAAPLPVAAVVFAYYSLNPQSPIILRPQIPFFYMIGIYIALWKDVHVRLPAIPVLGLFALVLALQLMELGEGELYDLWVLRPVTAAAFWVFARTLRGVPRFRRAIFAFFLSHVILFHIVGALLPALWIEEAWLPLWMMTPPLVFAAVVAAMRLWDRVEPHAPGPIRRLVNLAT